MLAGLATFHWKMSALMMFLSLVTKIWSSLATGGEEPQALNLTSVVVDSAIYTFGGILDGEGSNRLHIFDTG